jgi:hypothetical protein
MGLRGAVDFLFFWSVHLCDARRFLTHQTVPPLHPFQRTSSTFLFLSPFHILRVVQVHHIADTKFKYIDKLFNECYKTDDDGSSCLWSAHA